MEILIVTFRRDFRWTEFALQSIQKFGRGFHALTLLVPDTDETIFRLYEKPYGCRVKTFKERPAPYGMLHHMAMIGRADEICPEAEAIMHVDSDCFFFETFAPEDYMLEGKPLLLYADYGSLPPHMPWQPIVSVNLGMDWPWETMRRLPLLHVPETYQHLRLEIERVHKKSFDDYVFSCRPHFPEGFCEFNCLGAIAMRDISHRYVLMDVSKSPYPRNKMYQFWSRATPETEVEIWHEGQKRKVVPMEIIEDILRL
jgi:hypothetical protein